MDLVKSLTYIFEDDDWIVKIAINLGVGLAATFLMPVLFAGLIFVAAQNGWTVQLIRNVMNGKPNPMPTWDDFGGKISLGLQPMIAGVVYFLPLIILSCILFVPAALAGDSDAGGALVGGAMCCIVPVFIVYGVLAAALLNMGLIRYADTEQLSTFFEFSALWEMLTRDTNLTIRYVAYLFVIGLIMGAVSSTGIGSIVAPAFTPPINGHLAGQFATELGAKPKRA
ncbi:MAG: DUF4013 domain-containing protein [Chloroflexota bacterium]